MKKKLRGDDRPLYVAKRRGWGVTINWSNPRAWLALGMVLAAPAFFGVLLVLMLQR